MGVDGFELLLPTPDVEVLFVDIAAGVEVVVLVGVARLAGRIAVAEEDLLLLVRGEVFELELPTGTGVDFSPASRPKARAIIAAERVLM